MLFDSHVHLEDERFDEDRDALIRRLREDGVEAVVDVGSDVQTSEKAVALAAEYPFIYAAVGIHPHEVEPVTEADIEAIRALSTKERVVAIGEIGLDYYYDNSPRELQKKWFERQLILAKECDLPVVIHSRDAAEDTLNILKKHADGLRGEMHCYSYSVEMMREFLKLGFYVALGGAVTFKNARVPKEVAKIVPLDRLMLETDCPYMTPEPFRGKRNEPKYTKYVAEKIAEIREMSVEELISATTENTRRLFGI